MYIVNGRELATTYRVRSCVLQRAGSLVFGSVLRQDEKMYKCDAYNYVVRQSTGGSYHRLVVRQGIVDDILLFTVCTTTPDLVAV